MWGSLAGFRRTNLISAIAICLVALASWVPYQWRSGFSGETGFTLNSLSVGLLQGFTYQPDPVRPLLAAPYQTGFVLSVLMPEYGDFVWYQAVLLLLKMGLGLLYYVLLANVLRVRIYAAAASALVVTAYGADDASNWVGQMHQTWFIVWALVAACLIGLRVRGRLHVGIAGVMIGFAALVLSLWTYEGSIIFSLVLIGGTALLAPGKWGVYKSALLSSYVAVYLFSGVRIYSFYTGSESVASYQSQISDTTVTAEGIFTHLLSHLLITVRIDDWGVGGGVGAGLVLVSVLAGLIAAAAVVSLRVRVDRSYLGSRPGLVNRHVILLLAWILGLFVAASLPYVPLMEGATPWRQQFMSAIPFGLLVVLVLRLLPGAMASARGVTKRPWAPAIMTFLLVTIGVNATVTGGRSLYEIWERQQLVMVSIIERHPCIARDSLIRLTTTRNEFGHPLWFTNAILIVYPGLNREQVIYDSLPETSRPETQISIWSGSGSAETVCVSEYGRGFYRRS